MGHPVAYLIIQFYLVLYRRNDYQHISDKVVTKFKVPYLRESFCFVNLAKSINRYVASIDWHPKYSGLVVAAYTFSVSSTSVPSNFIGISFLQFSNIC